MTSASRRDDSNRLRVLITGGTGLLGTQVVRLLRGRHDLAVQAPPRSEVDLLSRGALASYLDRHPADVIIHLAADCGGIGYNRRQPASLLANNLTMALEVYAAATSGGVRTVVAAGSCDGYPATASMPWREEDIWDGLPEQTSRGYGHAKRQLVAMAEANHQEHGITAVTLSFINMYGENDHFDVERGHLIPAVIRRVAEAKDAGAPSIQLWGDGSPRRELLYAADAAEIVVRACDQLRGCHHLNVGSGQVHTVREIADAIRAEMDYAGTISYDSSAPNGHPLKQLDLTRLRSVLGPLPEPTPLSVGLRRTVAGFRAQQEAACAALD